MTVISIDTFPDTNPDTIPDTIPETNYVENNKITILSILPNEDKCKVKKHIFFYKKEDNNYIKNIIKIINKKYESKDSIIKYLLNFNLNLSVTNLEDIYNNNITIFNNDYNSYDLNIIKNLKNISNNNENNENPYFNETNSLIFILEKKEKIYYMKNRNYKKTRNFNKNNNNTKKVRNQ
jgi:hypothetical protein